MTATIDPVDVESIVAGLSADQLAQLGATFTARAADRRRLLTVDEARAVFDTVPDIPDWQWTGFRECGQIRKACEILIAWQRLHPEQVAPAMIEVAIEVCSEPWGEIAGLIAREAVAAGIVDGRFALEADDDGD